MPADGHICAACRTWSAPDGPRSHQADRALLLADAERPQDHDLARGVRACPTRSIPVNIGKGDQFKPEFLAISPNNRMPAIVDPDGPGGQPISIFESGAILQYLGRKTGQFYPRRRARPRRGRAMAVLADGRPRPDGRARPTTSATTRRRSSPYAIDRYTNEVNRLYGVMDRRLADRDFLAGDYSIADMACDRLGRAGSARARTSQEFPAL